MPSQPPRPSPSTRRQFLANTAAFAGAAAAGGALAGCSATEHHELAIPKAAPPVPLGPDEPIRVGLIGCGGMGNGHLDGFFAAAQRGAEKVEVVAVCDVNRKRAEGAQRKCADKQKLAVDAYRAYPELLARDDVHAVLIASPEHWHAKMAEDAIAAGKDVYLEKPMTLRLADALRLRRVVHANDRLLQVGTQYMTTPKYGEARKLIQSGAIGTPTLSQTSYCRNSRDGEWLYGIDAELAPGPDLDWEAFCGPLGPRPWDTEIYHRWRRYRDFSTGIVGDLLVHQMTPIVWALDLGWPVRVSAHGAHLVDKAMENHDQVLLTVSFEGGHTLLVAGSTCNDTGLEVLVRGHEASLFLGGNRCVLRPQPPFVDDVDPQELDAGDNDPQDTLRLDWLRCIRTREAVRSPVDYGAQVMAIVDLATRSMWEGRSFGFDPRTLSPTVA